MREYDYRLTLIYTTTGAGTLSDRRFIVMAVETQRTAREISKAMAQADEKLFSAVLSLEETGNLIWTLNRQELINLPAETGDCCRICSSILSARSGRIQCNNCGWMAPGSWETPR